MAKGLEIRQKATIKASPAKVFQALTDPKVLTQWFLRRSRVDLRPGGKMLFVWRNFPPYWGTVKTVKKEKEFAVIWPHKAEGGQKETVVRFTLSKRGKKTRLDLHHAGFGWGRKWVQHYGLTQQGWAYYLRNLKSVLETGYDLREEDE